MTDLDKMISRVESSISDPHEGLPQEVFLFITRNTPMINVDLLIKNEQGQTLLTWREDGRPRAGWHVPGGIIRYKESFAERIVKTARNELGVGVEFNPVPLVINECISAHMKNRGHFISLLFECILAGKPSRDLECRGGQPGAGEWMWHDRCPENILALHAELYGKFIDPQAGA